MKDNTVVMDNTIFNTQIILMKSMSALLRQTVRNHTPQ